MAAIVIAGEVVAVNAEIDEDIVTSEIARGDLIGNLQRVGPLRRGRRVRRRA